jgi:IS5 family transposase
MGLTMGQHGLCDWEQRQQQLQQQKTFLPRLDSLIPWSDFRPILEQVYAQQRKSNAGRKPTDVILKFKMLILQRLYNIGDNELEYQVHDRLSFMKFLHLGLEDKVPDATTIALFREQLTQLGLIEALYAQFESYLVEQGYQAKGGQIIDASFVPVPKQHNKRSENEQIKAGQVSEDWSTAKKQQKDVDACWTKKNDESYFGYKNHVNIDATYGFIRAYAVTNAAVHDSQMLGAVLDAENEGDTVWADSAYRSEDTEWALGKMGFHSQIHERGYRNHPLMKEQKSLNREKSRIRARVEHVFGRWVNEMGGKLLRGVGQIRIAAKVGLFNLSYNLKRYVYLQTVGIV